MFRAELEAAALHRDFRCLGKAHLGGRRGDPGWSSCLFLVEALADDDFAELFDGNLRGHHELACLAFGGLNDGQQKMARSNLLVLKLRRKGRCPVAHYIQILAWFHLIYVSQPLRQPSRDRCWLQIDLHEGHDIIHVLHRHQIFGF